MTRHASALLVVALAATSCSGPRAPAPATTAAWPSGPLVDLSHDYGEDTVFWPTAERFSLQKVADGVTPGGFYYAANNLTLAEHGGTHLDAPIHFAANRQTTDEIPVSRLVGPAVVVDVADAIGGNADYLVPTTAFETWERANGRIPDGAIVLIRTGYASRWPDAARYLGTAERGAGAVPKLHFPGLDPAAATWLAERRSIDAVGIDTASIDYGQSSAFEAHRILCDRNIAIFENLTSLDRLPAAGAFVVALPMKIRGGSGGPLRAIAFLPGS